MMVTSVLRVTIVPKGQDPIPITYIDPRTAHEVCALITLRRHRPQLREVKSLSRVTQPGRGRARKWFPSVLFPSSL